MDTGGERQLPHVLPGLDLGLAPRAPCPRPPYSGSERPHWPSPCSGRWGLGGGQPGAQAQVPPEAGPGLRPRCPEAPVAVGERPQSLTMWPLLGLPHNVASGFPQGMGGGSCRGLGTQSQDVPAVTPSSSETSAKGGPPGGGRNDHVPPASGSCCEGQPGAPRGRDFGGHPTVPARPGPFCHRGEAGGGLLPATQRVPPCKHGPGRGQWPVPAWTWYRTGPLETQPCGRVQTPPSPLHCFEPLRWWWWLQQPQEALPKSAGRPWAAAGADPWSPGLAGGCRKPLCAALGRGTDRSGTLPAGRWAWPLRRQAGKDPPCGPVKACCVRPGRAHNPGDCSCPISGPGPCPGHRKERMWSPVRPGVLGAVDMRTGHTEPMSCLSPWAFLCLSAALGDLAWTPRPEAAPGKSRGVARDSLVSMRP